MDADTAVAVASILAPATIFSFRAKGSKCIRFCRAEAVRAETQPPTHCNTSTLAQSVLALG
jgi:hypothetical protein